MPFHFCQNELMIIMMAIPIIGGFIHWLRHKICRTKCNEDQDCIPKCEHLVEKEIYDPLDP